MPDRRDQRKTDKNQTQAGLSNRICSGLACSLRRPSLEPAVLLHAVETQKRQEAPILLHPEQLPAIQVSLVAFSENRELKCRPFMVLNRLLEPPVGMASAICDENVLVPPGKDLNGLSDVDLASWKASEPIDSSSDVKRIELLGRVVTKMDHGPWL